MIRKYGIYGFDNLGKTIHGVSGSKVRRTYELVAYDPYSKSLNDPEVLRGCDIILVTRRMVYDREANSFVTIEIENLMKRLQKDRFDGVLVFKQTFLPGTLDLWQKRFGLRMVHNPDFSSEKNLMADFRRSECQTISGAEENRFRVMRAYEFLFKHYINFRQYDKFLVTEMTSFMNSALCAAKFSIVRHFQELSRGFDIDFAQVREASVFSGLEHERFLHPNLIAEDLNSALSNYAEDTSVFAEKFHGKFNQASLFGMLAVLKEYGLSK